IAKRFKTKPTTSSKLPPGPWKVPLLGNLHELMLGPLPHHTLRDLAKKHGPLMHLQLGEVSTIIVSSPKVAKQVMNTHDLLFADRGEFLAARILTYNYTDVAFSPYRDYWRQLRKIFVLEFLSAKQVLSFRSTREEEEVSNFTDRISSKAGSQINLSDMVFLFTNDVICRAAFGNACKDKEEFKAAFLESIKLGGGFDISDMFPSLKFLHVISEDRIFGNVILEHKKTRITSTKNQAIDRMQEMEEDLVDVLLRLQENGELEFPITTDNIKAFIL
ncbi:hypothetical protein MKW94_029818, partial [Papaver nudicaule]|nr:hypothetical protein [Papaver nudicaule]